jgi:hypothetical protein
MAFGARQSRMVLCVQCLRVRTRAAAMCASRWSEGSGGGGRGSALLLHVTVVWLHVTCGRRSRPCRRGLAMLFALRRRHLAELGGLRTHPKNTNRVHWSGNAPRLSTSIRCNAVAAHPQEHGSSGRESSRKHAALPVHRNQPDSATTEARRGSAYRKNSVRYASGGAGAPCSSGVSRKKRPLVAR